MIAATLPISRATDQRSGCSRRSRRGSSTGTRPTGFAAKPTTPGLIAPSAPLPEPDHPDQATQATYATYAAAAGNGARRRPGSADIVVVWGAGGGVPSTSSMRALAAAASPHRLYLAGRVFEGFDVAPDGNVVVCGWLDEPRRLLTERPTVVSSAGNNAVALAATAGCPLVVVPQERPFDEQMRHAQVLERCEVAAAVWGEIGTGGWRVAIELARRRRDRLGALASERADRRAASFIERALLRPSIVTPSRYQPPASSTEVLDSASTSTTFK